MKRFKTIIFVTIFSLLFSSGMLGIAYGSILGTVNFTDSSYIPVDNYQVGENAYVQAADADMNSDPGIEDTLTVELTSTTEATPEVVTLTETGADTGIFRGSIVLDDVSGVAAPDGDLDVTRGDFIIVTYNDPADDFGNPAAVTDTAIFGATVLSGQNITADTIWTKAASPYVLTGDIVIGTGVTLTIEPGVEVRFAPNQDDNNQGRYEYDVEIIVAGVLDAQGTVGERIVFTSNAQNKAAGDWGGIRFGPGSGTIRYCLIEYATQPVDYSNYPYPLSITIDNNIISNNNGGISIRINQGGTLVISNNTLSGNINSGYRDLIFTNIYYEGAVTISGNEITGNSAGMDYIIRSNAPGGVISNNTITDNTNGHGIYSVVGEVTNNTISSNSLYRVIYGLGAVVISGNAVTGNTGTEGIYLNGSGGGATVSNNTVTDNGNATGIYINGNDVNALYSPVIEGNTITGNIYGIQTINYATSLVNNNNIYGNTIYDYYNNTIYEQDAKNNFWGVDVTAEMEAGGNPKGYINYL